MRLRSLAGMIKMVICMALAISCTPAVYFPSLRNVPMPKEKGELKITGSVGSGKNIQAAYAPTTHLVLTGNFVSAKFFDNDSLSRDHQSVDIGIGYFINRKEYVYDFSLSYGKGKGQTKDTESNGWFLPPIPGNSELYIEKSLEYTKYQLQASIGQNKGSQLQGSLISRATLIHIHSLKQVIDGEESSISNKTKLFWEPAILINLVPDTLPIYFTFQAGLNLSNDHLSSLNQPLVSFGFGVGLQFNMLSKSREK